jgi:Na+/melibiose symporter-like transporter
MTLRVLYALVPSLFNLLGLGIALFYPIHPKAHQEILAAIQKRRAGQKVQDPLKPERALPGLEPERLSKE